MSSNNELNFLLNDFTKRVAHVNHAVAVSADGLKIAATDELPTDRVDQLSAVASGLVSLLRGAARLLETGSVVSNLTEMDGGFLFSMAVNSGASLLVLAAKHCDIGFVSYEMTELINRVGGVLTPDTRGTLLTVAQGQP